MKTITKLFAVPTVMIVTVGGLTPFLKGDDDSSSTLPLASSTAMSDSGNNSGLQSSSAGNSSTPARVNGSSSWLGGSSESKLPFHFGLNLTEIYDDNIYLQPTKTYDYITQIAPSISYVLGDQESPNENYLSAFYQPTFLIYAHTSGNDAVEQDVAVNYSHTFTKLRLGLGQQYQKLSDATIDSNAIVNRNIYTTTATADYDYSDKLSLHAIATQTITDYETAGQADTNEWNLNMYSLYDLTAKLKVGLGPLIGFLDQQYAPSQTYEELLGHVQYQATGKITAALAFGLETRQYQYGPGNQITPVFDLRGDYQATDSTAFFIDGHAETYAATSLQGQNYQDITIQGGVRQRVIQKLFFNVNVGYDNSSYKTLNDSLATETGRTDNYYFVKTGVAWIPNDWMLVTGSYQYSKDNSNYSFASFNDNQYSISCQFKY